MEKEIITIEASSVFRKAYGKLPPIMRERVDHTVEKLATNLAYPGLRIERVRGASENVRSCRVNGGFRVIFEITDARTIRLLYIGNHDMSYRKAALYWITRRFVEEEVSAENLGGFAMFKPQRTYGEEDVYKDLTDVLREVLVSNDIVPSIVRLIRQTTDQGTEGKSRPLLGEQPGDMFNVIPSDMEGPCRDVLVAFCFDGDSFKDRLREVAYHAGIHCPDTKVVVIVTSQWNPKDWKKNHEKAFADLRAVMLIYLAGFGRLTRIA